MWRRNRPRSEGAGSELINTCRLFQQAAIRELGLTLPDKLHFIDCACRVTRHRLCCGAASATRATDVGQAMTVVGRASWRLVNDCHANFEGSSYQICSHLPMFAKARRKSYVDELATGSSPFSNGGFMGVDRLECSWK